MGKRNGNNLVKLLVLVASATLMAEVLSGSTTWTRIQYLPVQFLLYGSAAIVVREIARRIQGGWATILLFGAAFGYVLEGFVLQSVFNPHFLGLNISLGNALGINWVWSLYMPAFHSFWSITGPIMLTELFFTGESSRPWTNRWVLYVVAAIFVLLATAFHYIFIKMMTFDRGFAVAVIAIPAALFILAGVRLAKNKYLVNGGDYCTRFPLGVFLLTYASGALWYVGFVTIFIDEKPAAWIPLLTGPVLLLICFTMMTKIPSLRIDSLMKRFAVVAGLLLSGWIFGYFATASNKTDHFVQIGLLAPIIIMLLLLYKKIRKQVSESIPQTNENK